MKNFGFFLTFGDGHSNLASVASDVMGVSGRAMLCAIVKGDSNPELMADLAKGTMRHRGRGFRRHS
ncbi:MAG: hypothetical protein QNJ36_14875 [Calothrix sp. MO_167.B42]|nr:hypothetical protein [Calothrix sp. MO_167.B42]